MARVDDGRALPERIGPYRVVHRLGRGGMGEVFLALDGHGRTVAVKVVHPHLVEDGRGLRRFAREAAAMRRVASPFVTEIVGAELTGPVPYIAARYVEGRSLREVVAAEGPLDATAARRVAKGVAEAMRAIHSVGVVHRDLTPGNIMLCQGTPVVIDLGIAKDFDSSTMTHGAIGTPGYIAPEILRGDEIGVAADVFTWAATMVFAVTAHECFPGTGLGRSLNGEPDLTGVPGELVPLLERALDKDPGARPPVAEVLRHCGRPWSWDAAGGGDSYDRRQAAFRAAMARGDTAGARAVADALLEDARRDGDPVRQVEALHLAADVADECGDQAESRRCRGRALTIARRVPDRLPERVLVARCLSRELRDAEREERETLHGWLLEIAREVGDRRLEVASLCGLAEDGRGRDPVDLLRRALEVAAGLGALDLEIDVVRGLADLLSRRDENREAEELYERLVTVAAEAEDQRTVAEGLMGVARCAARRHDDGRAFRAYERAMRVVEEFGEPADQVASLIRLAREADAAGLRVVAALGRVRALDVTAASAPAGWLDADTLSTLVTFLEQEDDQRDRAPLLRALTGAAEDLGNVRGLLALGRHAERRFDAATVHRVYTGVLELAAAGGEAGVPRSELEDVYDVMARAAESGGDVAELRRLHAQAAGDEVNRDAEPLVAVALARVLVASGRREEAERLREWETQASEDMEDRDLRARYLVGLGLLMEALGRRAEGERRLEEAWALARYSRDDRVWSIRDIGVDGLLRIVDLRLREGTTHVVTVFGRSMLDHAKRTGDKRVEALARCVTAQSESVRGLPGDGYEEAYLLAEELGDADLVAHIERACVEYPPYRPPVERKRTMYDGLFVSLLSLAALTGGTAALACWWPVAGWAATAVVVGMCGASLTDGVMFRLGVFAASVPAAGLVLVLGTAVAGLPGIVVAWAGWSSTPFPEVLGVAASLVCYTTLVVLTWKMRGLFPGVLIMLQFKPGRTALGCVLGACVVVAAWGSGGFIGWWPLDGTDVPFGTAVIP